MVDFGTLHKARNADFRGSTANSGAAAELLLAGIFCRWATAATAGWPAKCGDAGLRISGEDFFARHRWICRTIQTLWQSSKVLPFSKRDGRL
jgi:hypothetical protein